jgi:uncharacterized protein (TIGR00369 family)
MGSDEIELDPEQLTAVIEEMVPFNRHLGLQVERIERGRADIRLPYRDDHVGDILRPALHGGVVAALVDATAGAAAFTRARAVDRMSTLDIRIDYLRPAPKADLVASAHVRRMGNRVAVVNVLVTANGESEPVAEGRAVFSIRRDVGVPDI